ncbi:citryl-CoA lyase [Microbacteriaceae bacterium K1510]|nr:citryl-CoA lyase [Microbacteriaceae bacterium K1510]
MASKPKPTTKLCLTQVDRITVRDHDLVTQLMGEKTFTEVFALLLTGSLPSPQQTRLIDAVLLTLMEHGLTPQAIAARMIARCEPEAMQAAIAAGLLGIGSRFGGAMSATSILLTEIIAAGDKGREAAQAIIARHRTVKKSIAGFGHPQHRPDDPRSQRLFQIAREGGIAGKYVDAIHLLSEEIDKAFGRHLTINTTGAIAAVLGDLGVPDDIMRGFAVVSRSAGLVAHLKEESEQQVAAYLTDFAEHDIEYVGKVP